LCKYNQLARASALAAADAAGAELEREAACTEHAKGDEKKKKVY
jgi:hypothetical protein